MTETKFKPGDRVVMDLTGEFQAPHVYLDADGVYTVRECGSRFVTLTEREGGFFIERFKLALTEAPKVGDYVSGLTIKGREDTRVYGEIVAIQGRLSTTTLELDAGFEKDVWTDTLRPETDNRKPNPFKVGDRVRSRNSKNSKAYKVRTLGNSLDRRKRDMVGVEGLGVLLVAGLELAPKVGRPKKVKAPTPVPAAPAPQEPKKSFIVALVEGAKPRPATKPKPHATREDAVTEATRLAAKHEGSVFAVFEAISAHRVVVQPVPQTFTF